jgi:hypothetical protein
VTRVVVVLGYSDGSTTGLHPLCAARVAHAARLAREDDVVVLSGWARRAAHLPEAELMREAWVGPCARLVVDPDARTTAENARNALDDIVASAADVVVVVTSSWHARRARAAFRWLLRGRGIDVVTASPPGASRRSTLRELALLAVLPAQLAGVPPPRGRGRPRTRRPHA